ncbi:methyltransferase [Lentzea sp. NPDC059081]|uniref:methyltransferase n=1 Tax=Lentzea sp. NPDC059081 TaxID=3346719 RepID=UPI0036AB1ABE
MTSTVAPVTPIPLMELTTGFWKFKALAAAVDIGLFAAVHRRGEATAADLVADLGLEPRPLRMLLGSCTALGLLDKDGRGYRNAPPAAEFLVPGGERYFGGFVQYSDRHAYPAWGRLQEALRTNAPTTWDASTQDSAFVAETSSAILENFWDAMFSISSFTADALADAHDFGRHRRLLDVGGGMGPFPVGLCRRYPHLRATVYDLPHIAAKARAKVEGLGLSDRITAHGGDFLADAEFPAGHDVVLLSMILHDWDEPTSRAILRKCHAALPSGGAVIICELVLDDDETGPLPAAMMGLNMLVETRGGHNWTDGEYRDWLTGAGFGDIRTVPMRAAGANAAIIAVK